MTLEEAFRESFYRCLSSDLARIRFLMPRRSGFVSLMMGGRPLYLTDEPGSQEEYLRALRMSM